MKTRAKFKKENPDTNASDGAACAVSGVRARLRPHAQGGALAAVSHAGERAERGVDAGRVKACISGSGRLLGDEFGPDVRAQGFFRDRLRAKPRSFLLDKASQPCGCRATVRRYLIEIVRARADRRSQVGPALQIGNICIEVHALQSSAMLDIGQAENLALCLIALSLANS